MSGKNLQLKDAWDVETKKRLALPWGEVSSNQLQIAWMPLRNKFIRNAVCTAIFQIKRRKNWFRHLCRKCVSPLSTKFLWVQQCTLIRKKWSQSRRPLEMPRFFLLLSLKDGVDVFDSNDPVFQLLKVRTPTSQAGTLFFTCLLEAFVCKRSLSSSKLIAWVESVLCHFFWQFHYTLWYKQKKPKKKSKIATLLLPVKSAPLPQYKSSTITFHRNVDVKKSSASPNAIEYFVISLYKLNQ